MGFEIHIGWPQGIYMALTFLGVCIVASRHGQPRDDDYNIATTLPVTVFIYALLIWGGFFSP